MQVAYVETTKLALGGNIIEPVVSYKRRTGRRRQKKFAEAALYSRRLVLPEKLTVHCTEGHQDTALLLASRIQVP